MVKIADVIEEFNKKDYRRRTIKGLANSVNTTEKNINTILNSNPNIFAPEKGCKGDMWILK
jgi:hypothetical protein